MGGCLGRNSITWLPFVVATVQTEGTNDVTSHLYTDYFSFTLVGWFGFTGGNDDTSCIFTYVCGVNFPAPFLFFLPPHCLILFSTYLANINTFNLHIQPEISGVTFFPHSSSDWRISGSIRNPCSYRAKVSLSSQRVRVEPQFPPDVVPFVCERCEWFPYSQIRWCYTSTRIWWNGECDKHYKALWRVKQTLKELYESIYHC